MSEFTYFWGCQIPARFPFLEKGTRAAMERLGVECFDADGFTCCPERSLIKGMSEQVWLLTAARNLAVAERAGHDLLTVCNGCYGTLRGVSIKLKNDPIARAEINAKLEKSGLRYEGKHKVRHIVEFLVDDLGLGGLTRKVTKPLAGMRLAVHYGCHMSRPSADISFDDPLNPKKLDQLVVALGGQSVEYNTKMQCCGGHLANIGEQEDAMALTRNKLNELRDLKVDAVVLVCPACFLQFDQRQYLMQSRGEKLSIPILYLTELLAYALGAEKDELPIDKHRVDTEPFFEAWDKRAKDISAVRAKFDLAALERCFNCGACVSDCVVAENCRGFNPQEIIGKILCGEIEEAIKDPAIWMCVECHTCSEHCPQKFGFETAISILRHEALRQGYLPQGLNTGVKMFMETGLLGNPEEKQRKKMGLGPAPKSGYEELKHLLETVS